MLFSNMISFAQVQLVMFTSLVNFSEENSTGCRPLKLLHSKTNPASKCQTWADRQFICRSVFLFWGLFSFLLSLSCSLFAAGAFPVLLCLLSDNAALRRLVLNSSQGQMSTGQKQGLINRTFSPSGFLVEKCSLGFGFLLLYTSRSCIWECCSRLVVFKGILENPSNSIASPVEGKNTHFAFLSWW